MGIYLNRFTCEVHIDHKKFIYPSTYPHNDVEMNVNIVYCLSIESSLFYVFVSSLPLGVPHMHGIWSIVSCLICTTGWIELHKTYHLNHADHVTIYQVFKIHKNWQQNKEKTFIDCKSIDKDNHLVPKWCHSWLFHVHS